MCLSVCPNLFLWYCLVGLEPTHLTSFYLNWLFQGPISTLSHILRQLRVRTSTYEFRGNSIQSIIKNKKSEPDLWFRRHGLFQLFYSCSYPLLAQINVGASSDNFFLSVYPIECIKIKKIQSWILLYLACFILYFHSHLWRANFKPCQVLTRADETDDWSNCQPGLTYLSAFLELWSAYDLCPMHSLCSVMNLGKMNSKYWEDSEAVICHSHGGKWGRPIRRAFSSLFLTRCSA